MNTTEQLHQAIAKMQALMTQAADRIEESNNSLAESHTHDGIIKDREVLAIIESDADLVAHLRAASLPLDHRQQQDDNDFPLGEACDLSGEGTCEACQ